MSISILVSGAGIVSLGGTADASKLETGDPNKARRTLDGSIRRLAGWGSIGAGWWYCGKQVHKVHVNKVHIVHDSKASQNDRYDSLNLIDSCSRNGDLIEISKTESWNFIKAEVVFYTTLLHEWACIGGTKFTSAHDIVYHGHNGLHVHNNGANIAIPLGSKTESLHSTSERGTLCGNLVSLAHQWPDCQKVQG